MSEGMRVFVGDDELPGLTWVGVEVNRDFLDPAAAAQGLRAFRSTPREITTTLSMLEVDAGPILDAFGNPGRTISLSQHYHYSRWRRLGHWLLRAASRWLVPPLLTEVGFAVEGMRPIRMTRHGGIVDVEFSNRDLES